VGHYSLPPLLSTDCGRESISGFWFAGEQCLTSTWMSWMMRVSVSLEVATGNALQRAGYGQVEGLG
jgi:hypothetical protein